MLSTATGGSPGSGRAFGAGGGLGSGGIHGNAGANSSTASDAATGTDAPPSCNLKASPSTEPCLLDDKYAVFVKQGAVGPGTKAEPVGSIAGALAAAKQSGRQLIIVCSGTYLESIAIDDAQGPLAIYGGFSCDAGDGGAWAYDSGKRPVIEPVAGVALTITDVTQQIIISDINVRSPDATLGTSSIAATITRSMNVTLLRVGVSAGAGGSGAAGVPGAAGANGWDASLGILAAAPTCMNPPASQPGGYWPSATECGSIGGSGGAALFNGVGQDGQPGQPQEKPFDNGGKADTTGQPGVYKGGDGRRGTVGDPGSAAITIGAFTASSYQPADGNGGTDGHTGQGGGGGGAGFSNGGCTAGGGEAGGMGGCGGNHGSGGHGGGASIALIAWDSGVLLQDVTLLSAAGGDGGNGGDGGAGGVGMLGPRPPKTLLSAGAVGGRGGPGGDGGSGSGGTGGPSIALVYHGAAPREVGQTTLTASTGGLGGKGGAVGVDRSNPAPDGAPGKSSQRFEVTP